MALLKFCDCHIELNVGEFFSEFIELYIFKDRLISAMLCDLYWVKI